jgi:AmmeMemoRadiSam system protein B
MIEAVLALDPRAVLKEAAAKQNSCCAGAVAGAIAAAVALGANRGTAVDYTTSYDKQPGDSFVGYLAALFQEG